MALDFAIMVTVTFFSGGRKTPPCFSSRIYRPHFVVKGDDEYLGVCFVDGPACGFDQAVSAVVLPIYEGVHYGKLRPGAQFFIMEGPNRAGEGIAETIVPHISYQEMLRNGQVW